MTLRTRIRLLVLVSTLIALWLLGVFFAAYREKIRAEQDLALSESLTVATAQLRTVLFGHLLSPHTQPRSQVEAQFKRLADLLEPGAQSSAASAAPDADTRYAWNGARRMVSDLSALLADLDATGTDPRLSGRGRQTTELILMNSHAMTLFVSQINDGALDGYFQASAREHRALGLLLAGLAAIGLGLLLLIERSLLLPIDRLRQAVLQIGGSATALRLNTHRRDELGQLANAFDHLLDQIQETTVSRDRLAVEVDERARAECALQESRDWLHLAMQTSRSFAFAWEPQEGDRVWRSTTCAAILGLSGETAEHDSGQGYFQRVVPADRARFIALLESLRPGEDHYRTEYRVIRGDGETVVLEETAQGFFDTQGRLQRLVGATADITERRVATDALKKNRDLLNVMGRMARVGGWEVDLVTGQQAWTEAIYDIHELDYAYTPTVEKGIAFYAPESRPIITEAVRRAIDLGEPYDLELKIVTAKGRRRWVHTMGRAVREGSRTIALSGTFQDITERKQAELELDRQRIILQQAEHLARIGAWEWEIAPDRLNLSAEFLSMHGLQEAMPLTLDELLPLAHPQDLDAVQRAFQDALDGKQPYDIEHRIIRRDDGSIRFVHAKAEVSRNARGEPIKMIGVSQDITERTQAAEALRQSEERFRTLAEAVPQIVWMTRPDGWNSYFNQQWVDYTGLTLEESYGDGWNIPFHPDDRQRAWNAWQRAVQTDGVYALECRLRRADGVYRWWLIRGVSLHDAEGQVINWFGTCTDIQDLKDSEAQLERSAHYDGLTGLPNRVLLADRLQQEMVQAQRRARPVAVVLLDLDGFKTINDRHGHAAGDQFLIAVAARMRQALRAGDTFARLGGDEFVAVLPDLADTQEGVPLLARLLAAAAQPVAAGDRVLQASASLGATFYPQAEDIDAEQLLRQADQAMYQAKLAGKNCYHVFDAEHDRALRGHHEVLERIRRALVDHEFVLYYQPKVNMRTGAVIGAEALIRWQHPERGLLLPGAFLQVIEDHPLAIAIGEWVIDSALTQMECWQATGREFPVSVNVGARQLQQANFVERLRAILAAHPTVRPGHLELEVLETGALELTGASRVLDACRELGVLSALDDFGTGFSSLTYLRRLPVTQLKIDQSFVRDMLVDPDDLAIIEAVLGLASAFHRQVIAEGVESVAQGELLLWLGCELAQGYAIARPMPAVDLPGWSAAWRPDPAWTDLPAVSRDDLPLLFAGVEHHAWMMALDNHLKGERAAPPLDYHGCRFGNWLDADSLARYSAQPAAAVIKPLHQKIHMLAATLCDLHAQDRTPEALARLGELHDLQDALLEHIKFLIRNRMHPSG